MSNRIKFFLDNQEITAQPDETIWQAAQKAGVEIPHLCWQPYPDYRPDGNCRVCMVEIDGERVLAPSCHRKPTEGMRVQASSDRARKAQTMVAELLLADQPNRTQAHDPDSILWHWADHLEVTSSRFPARDINPPPDCSHPAMAVNLDACIHCTLCIQACREIQVNDVIGMSGRGAHARIVFDSADPMGESSCVACGECVQACPTGALMPATVLDENQVHKPETYTQVESVCPYCGVGCQITYNLRDGETGGQEIAFVDGKAGPANHARLCVKGRFGFDYVANPQRLTKPLIRRDDVPKAESHEKIDPHNPLTHFREASWEEALDRAAAGFKKLKTEQGSKALAGFGSAKGSNEEAYLVQKLIRTGFGTNNVDHCTRLCHASSVAALMETIGSGAVTAPFNAALQSDLIIVIGARPTENHPVAATFFKNAAKAGKQLIIMDPRGHGLVRHAALHLQFKPGTDVAMLNALLYTIIDEDLYDKQYVAANTEGFENLRHSVRAFTPEKMAKICGISAETLREVARRYARANRGIIFWGMGISQHTHGTDNARCLIALALITGQIGRPGTGLHPLRGQNNVQGASDAGLIPMFFPDYKSVEDTATREHYESFWGMRLDPTRGLTVVEIMDAVHDDVIRGIYVMGENPAMSDPDLNHARAGLAKLEHLVVQDIFMTETAAYADIVLPASAWPEKEGTVTNTNRQVQIGRQALPSPGEAQQDWWIIQEIANRLGLGWSYTHPRDIFAEMAQIMPSLANISWARLEREDAVTYPCEAPDRPGAAIVFGDGFPTPTGRGKLVPTQILLPDEQPDSAFPMVLTTGRLLEHWHTGSMTRRSNVLDALEPEPHVQLNPADLTRLGIEAGVRVHVATRRGSVALMTREERDVPEGVLFIPFCYREAAANLLTNAALDPFGKIPEFKFCAARIETE